MSHNLTFLQDNNSQAYIQASEITFIDRDILGNHETSVAIRGWIIADSGIPQTAIITCKGMIIGACCIQDERADIVAQLGLPDIKYKPGFHLRFGTLCLPHSLLLDVWVDIRHESGETLRVRLGTIRGTRSSLPEGIIESRYSPIIVPAMGRSGTTLMMGLLNAHPRVISPGDYPYEYRQASYFWHAARVLSSPASFDFSMHPDSFEASHFYNVGYNPYIDRQYHKAYDFNAVSAWQDRELPIATINFFKAMVDQFLEKVLLDTGRVDVEYFAEKTILSPLNDLVMNIYPSARQVVLVRDIRDSFLSARAFNKKRGTNSFGFADKNETEVLASRKHDADMMVYAYRFADERTLFVRYEDLIADQSSTIKRLVEFLGLDAAPSTIRSMIGSQERNGSVKSAHSTTRDPISSIERWKNELTDEEKAYCSMAYREFLDTFGYAIH